jgi:type IV pilus assembly protein PilC
MSEGTLTAASRTEALNMLRQRDNHLLSIEQEENRNVNLKFSKGVKARDISLFCKQFSSMLNAGINIMNCLDILRNQLPNKRLREVVTDVYENVQKGLTLSEAMRRNKSVFPELMLSMITAGEVSGTLDNILKRLAVHYEKEYKLNNKIKSALVYPIILIVATIAVVTFLLTFIMPTFATLFESNNMEMPILTQFIINISNFVSSYWYIILLALVVIIVAIHNYIKSSEGRRHIDELKLKLPGIKDLNEKIISARFSRTMSTMMVSGIPLLQSLESVTDVLNNVVIKEGMKKTQDAVRSGKMLSEPIAASGMFPPMVTNMIKIGEESGTTDDLLDKAADFYDEEVEVGIQRLTSLFEPIMIIIMGFIVGFVVISMYLPLFQMAKAFQ